jgi:uncharacterized protein YjcR
VRIDFRGITKTAAEWGREFGINPRTITHRVLVAKWPKELAMTTPTHTRRKSNVMLTYKGETMPIATMARKYGIPKKVFDARIRRGWSAEKAVETPLDAVPENSKLITYNGETMPLVDICEKYNLPYMPTHTRLRRGWSVEDAIETPFRPFRGSHNTGLKPQPQVK